MSCLLIVSWVIEVEYTLTAIPQLKQRYNNTYLKYSIDLSSYTCGCNMILSPKLKDRVSHTYSKETMTYCTILEK